MRWFWRLLGAFFLYHALTKGPSYTARYLARRQMRRAANRAIRKVMR
ncbi:MAG TPA: hypothetical protein VFC51_14490 [Chloroflexota bacterium]|nr:hypothetical protein [Chloroflexota bacterium]